MSQRATDNQTGGALGWLDRLGSTLVNLTGSAATVRANLASAKTPDKTPVAANSPVQASSAAGGIPMLWIVGGVVVLAGAAFFLSRRG